jgi:hypothetical protein
MSFVSMGVHVGLFQTEVPQKKYLKVGAVLEVAPFQCDETALRGAGVWSALKSFNAAMLARSFEDVFGIAILEGKNSTVSTMPVPFVFVTCTW